jgi:hypothetical protein
LLTANQLHIDGRHHTLVPATSLEAHRGQVLLVQADGQERRTALALALTGRMKPTAGSVVLGHDHAMATLRKRSAIIDSPDVNEPETHLTVRSLVSEDLALVPLKFRDRTRPTAWLVKHGFRDVLEQWVEELDADRLLHLLLELALANRDVDLLVVDSPDRHSAESVAWLKLLEEAAAGQLGRGADTPSDAPARELIVVGVVGRIPDGWTGPTAVAGEAVLPTAGPALTSTPAPDEVPEAPVVDAVDAAVAEPIEIPVADDARDPQADAPVFSASAASQAATVPQAEPEMAQAGPAGPSESPLVELAETTEADTETSGSRRARSPEATTEGKDLQ